MRKGEPGVASSSSSSSDDTVFTKADRGNHRDDTSSEGDSSSTSATPETSPSLASEEQHALRHQTRSAAHTSGPVRVDFGQTTDRASMRGARKCSICCETDITPDSAFTFGECNHSFCLSCWRRHILEDLKSGRFPPRCLAENCSGRLSMSVCESLLSEPTDRHLLKQAEREASIPQDQRFWCPRPACARVFKHDPKAAKSPPSKCPHCQQLACLRCQQPWAEGHSCRKVKEAGMDASVMQLAQDKRWRQCPCCRQMVEKRGGCNAIRCKCSCEFCYVCGKMSSNCECWARMTRTQRAISVIGGVIFCCLCCPCVCGLVVYECYHHN